MSKKKILHLIKSLGRGGAEMLIPETVKHHDREKYQFYCVYFLPWKDQMVPDLKAAGVTVRCIKANNSLLMVGRLWHLIKYLREENIDLIHCHLPWAGILGRLAHAVTGIPVVYTEHNKQERYHFLTKFMNLATLGWNDKVLAVSENVADSIRDHKGQKFPVLTLANGIDLVKNSRQSTIESAKAKLGIPGENFVIGNVCVFRIQKRLPKWIEVAHQISRSFPGAKFLLVGDGPVMNDVVQKIRSLGLADRILLPGLKNDVRPYMEAMDVFMMTSEFEGLPLVLLEAMSLEVPVAATSAGGIPEVVQHGVSGLLVPVDEPERLTESLAAMLADKELRSRMGAAARARIREAYSIDQMVRQLENVYDGFSVNEAK